MEELKLSDIIFGKTDAFTELKEYGEEYFVHSFVSNHKYHYTEFLQGQKFYIMGKKGTGKSAFLRFLEYQFSNNEENLVHTIRFKSDFDEVDKDTFEKMSTKETEYDASEIIAQSSYVYLWKSFLLNKIVCEAKKGEYCLFEDNDAYANFLSLLKCIYPNDKDGNIIMPRISKGAIELSAECASALKGSIKLELEFDEKKKKINYKKLVKKAWDTFNSLTFFHGGVYVLIDELELSVRNKAQHEKDIALVRDLIIAIDELNSACSIHHFNIHFIASVRSEVANSIRSAGYELTKPLEDYGIEINWFQKGGDYKDNELLKIIENKIHASETLQNVPQSKDVWVNYFDAIVNGEETRKYILNNTLYRPRDIVRLMLALHDQIGDSKKFTQEMFDKAQQEYSKRMWTEITDELRLSYSEEEITSIFTLFNRIKLPFTYKSLTKRITDMAVIYPTVNALLEKHSLIDILNKLFELGIIGNTGAKMNFIFLEGKQIDPLQPMVIHTPLRNFFSVSYS